MNIEKFKLRLRSSRNELGLTQRELASKIDKTESSIRKYEAGIIEPPTSVIDEMARVLAVNPAWLQGYDVPSARKQTIYDINSDLLNSSPDLKSALIDSASEILCKSDDSASPLMIRILSDPKLPTADLSKLLNAIYERIDLDIDENSMNLFTASALSPNSVKTELLVRISQLNDTGRIRLLNYADDLCRVNEYKATTTT